MNTTRVRRSSLGHYGTSAMVAVATADADRPAPLSGAVRTGRGEHAKDQATLENAQHDLREAIVQHPLSVLAFIGDDRKQLAAGTLKLVNNQVDQSAGTVT